MDQKLTLDSAILPVIYQSSLIGTNTLHCKAGFRVRNGRPFLLTVLLIVSTQVALLFGSVSLIGFLDKGATSGVWTDRCMGKMSILECFSWILNEIKRNTVPTMLGLVCIYIICPVEIAAYKLRSACWDYCNAECADLAMCTLTP